MSRLDQDREDLIRLIISICDYARLGYKVSTYKNCNNCGRKECQFKPDWGKDVRWNCPLAERKPWKWILKEHLYECDKCGCRISRFPFKGNIWNYYFCPNCGAKMEGGEHE